MQAGLQKTTLVNFPRRVAAAVFLPGCNMRCGYCHNGELAKAKVSGAGLEHSQENEYVDINAIYNHLEKRSKVLTGFAISGGEPMLSPALIPLIKKAKSLGLDVKIDTNGLYPEKLANILNTPELCPDMVALDIKTSPDRYQELMPRQNEFVKKFCEAALLRTLKILKEAVEKNPNFEVEYRTVLVPGLVGAKEIETLGQLIPSTAEWQFANFIPGHCLDPGYNDVPPYTSEQAEELEKLAQKYVPKAQIR